MSVMDFLNDKGLDDTLIKNYFGMTDEQYVERMTCFSPSVEMIADPTKLTVYGLWMDGDDGLALISWSGDCFDEEGYSMSIRGNYCEFDYKYFKMFIDDLSSFYNKSMKEFEEQGLFDE